MRRLVFVGFVLAAAALWWALAVRNPLVTPEGVRGAESAGAGPALVEVSRPAPATAPGAPGVARTAVPALPPVGVRGLVRDDKGPVAGVTVHWFAEPRSPEDVPLGSARTNAEGAFRGEASLGPERRFVAVVDSDAHEPASVAGTAGEPGVLLRLNRWVTVRGRVQEQGRGVPVVGATVGDGTRSVRTDADGRYELRTSIRRLGASLSARAPGFAPQEAVVRAHEDRADFDFDLHRTVLASFVVVDRDTGAPLAGAVVRRSSTGDVQALTGADGAFRIELVPARAASLWVEATAYAPLVWRWDVVGEFAVVVRLPLARLGTIAGRVVGEDGLPVPEAVLSVRRSDGADEERPLPAPLGELHGLPGLAFDVLDGGMEARSDADGRFELAVTADPAPYTVDVRHDDYVTATPVAALVARSRDRAEVVVRVTRGGSIVGRVVRGDQPLSGRMVTWRALASARDGAEWTDHDGSFRFPNVPPGRVTLRVTDPTGNVDGETIVEVMGGQVTRWDLATRELTGAIRGRVLTSGGRPLAGLPIRASAMSGKDPLLFGISTGEDGTYVLRCASGLAYTVSVWREYGIESRSGVSATATGVDFVLPEPGWLRLQLVDAATGSPLRVDTVGPWMFAWRPSGAEVFRSVSRRIDSNGRIEVRLPQGRIDVSVAVPGTGYSPRLVSDLLVADDPQPAAIPIALSRGVTWRLHVVGDRPFDRAARGSCQVFLLDQAQGQLLRGPFAEQGGESNHRINGVNLWMADPNLQNQWLAFDDDGVATLSGLAPGRYTLRALPDDVVFEPASLDVGAVDGRTELRWRRR